jgi:glyoxylase I family protein
MRILGFHHLAVQARDVERVASFYREILGFPERARHHRPDGALRSIWLEVPGGGFLAVEHCVGQIVEEGFRTSRPGWLLLALRIDREERGRVRQALGEAGVGVEHETRWTLYVRDPEGNRIGLSHHPSDPLVDPGDLPRAGGSA